MPTPQETIDSSAQSAVTLCDNVTTGVSTGQDAVDAMDAIDQLIEDCAEAVPEPPTGDWVDVCSDLVNASYRIDEAKAAGDVTTRDQKLGLVKVKLQAVRALIAQMVGSG